MNFWEKRKVLITGATGLLGSALTEELLNRRAKVVCLLRDSDPASRFFRDELSSRVVRVNGMLEDYELVLRAINEHEVNTVFHLGAQTIVGTALRSPLSTFESNIRGTWTLLEACRQFPGQVQRVVVASSDKAYGCCENLPYTEKTPLAGSFPYDVSKSCADLISLSYFQTYQLPVSVTRCGNLFGAGDLNFSRLIPGAIRAVLENQAPVIRSDGQFIRDYFYVRDAADAYLNLAEHMPASGVTGEAFNFGNETPISVIEMVDRILRLMNASHLKPVILNQGSNEIRQQYLDCSKARGTLNWTARYDLDTALRETIAWYEAEFAFEAAAAQDHAFTQAARR